MQVASPINVDSMALYSNGFTDKGNIIIQNHDENTKLFIGMLNKNQSEDDVRQLCEPYGCIKNCMILKDSYGNSKGCAFVTYNNSDEANMAIESLNGMKTSMACPELGSCIVARLADNEQERQLRKMQMQFPAIQLLTPQNVGYYNQGIVPMILQQFPHATDQQTANLINAYALQMHLSQMYSPNLTPPLVNSSPSVTPQPQIGVPMSAANDISSNQCSMNHFVLPSINNENIPLSPALNSYINPAHPQLINIANINFTPEALHLPSLYSMFPQCGFNLNTPALGLSGQNIYPNTTALSLQYQQNQKDGIKDNIVTGPEGCNLFIYHLPQDFGDAALAQLFTPFGNVISAKVYLDRATNQSKCFGFVSFDNASNAEAAIRGMNGFQIGTKRLKVQLKRPKGEYKN
uniref:Bruno-like n=1 Tax=Schmidtea mediterranea TaxID=79327 RepID=Q0H219_SCHMD|nr:bruno-like [Schmidtea mediterranea]